MTSVRVTKHGKVDKFAAYGMKMLETHGFVDVWGEGKTVVEVEARVRGRGEGWPVAWA